MSWREFDNVNGCRIDDDSRASSHATSANMTQASAPPFLIRRSLLFFEQTRRHSEPLERDNAINPGYRFETATKLYLRRDGKIVETAFARRT